jgi:hypothetical protein
MYHSEIATVFENILGCESAAVGEIFDGKTRVRKSRETVPLNMGTSSIHKGTLLWLL